MQTSKEARVHGGWDSSRFLTKYVDCEYLQSAGVDHCAMLHCKQTCNKPNQVRAITGVLLNSDVLASELEPKTQPSSPRKAMDLQVLLDWQEAPSDVHDTSISSVLEILRASETIDAPSASLQSVPSTLFATIQSWIALHQEKPLRNALVVWTKWFSLPGNLLPNQDILCSSDLKYFDTLQIALQDCIGHPALQKYVLYVLRKSLLLLDQDLHTESFDFEVEQKMIYLAEYNKYCSLFEIIVIGRSVNQAEECLHQVPRFEQPSGIGGCKDLEAEHGEFLQFMFRNFLDARSRLGCSHGQPYCTS